jgi:hypothetical protein
VIRIVNVSGLTRSKPGEFIAESANTVVPGLVRQCREFAGCEDQNMTELGRSRWKVCGIPEAI